MNKNKGIKKFLPSKPNSKSLVQLLEEGVRLYNNRRFGDLHALLEPALKKMPDEPGLNSLMGQWALVTDRPDAALGCFEKALSVYPGHVELMAQRAVCLLKLARQDEGKAALEALIKVSPDNVSTLKNLAILYSEQDEKEKMEECLVRASKLTTEDPEIFCLLGKRLIESSRGDEGRNYLKRAIKLRPTWQSPFVLLSSYYRQKCRFRTALSYSSHALKLDPNDLGSSVNYGVGLLDTGRLHESIAHTMNLLDAHPQCDQARFNLSAALLQIGRLQEGWEAYEARRKLHILRDNDLPYPDWQGEPLDRMNIFVLSEQGIGDEIWAANMFGDLIACAGHCIFECEPRLVSLFQRSFPQATIVPRLLDRIRYPKDRIADYKLPAMSLARWLRCRPEQFPGQVGYLIPDPERAKFWQWRVEQLGKGVKVGISWRSMNATGVRNASYTLLTQWSEIFSIDGLVFINLQYGECQDEINEAESIHGVTLHNFRDIDLKDGFEDVAALMSQLDIVIAPCNSVSALGGALNLPVLQFAPSNYWGSLGKEFDPWYPRTKLFFRPWDKDWSEALYSISVEVRRIANHLASINRSASVKNIDAAELLKNRLARAGLFLQSGQRKDARSIIEELAVVVPDNAEVLFMLGLIDQSDGHLINAEIHYRQALQLEFDYPEVHNQLGALLFHQDKNDEARKEFAIAIDLKPSYLDALNNIGTVFVAGGRPDKGQAAYERVIASFPGHILARYNLAMVLDDLGHWGRAEMEYRTVLDANPNNSDACNNLGVVLGKQGRGDDAVTEFNRAINLNPELVRARVNLAKQLLKSGSDLDEARRQLDLAIGDYPDDAKLHNLLGIVWASQKIGDKAKDSFLKAIELAPNYVEPYRNLASLLQMSGHLEEAKAILAEAVSAAGNVKLH